MRIMLTGVTGFIGRHLVRELLKNRHQVIAVVRNLERAKEFDWFDKVTIIQADLHVNFLPVTQRINNVDALIHLAWPGLPNYNSNFHIFQNLIADMHFLKQTIDLGLPQLMVAGTCLEYGLKAGGLTEEMDTLPITPYGFAKDSLRKSLEFLQKEKGFIFQWMRFFYMYGEGQNPKSLLSQLDLAIDEKRDFFEMSIGTQLRDYLSVETVAENLCKVIESPELTGVINCSSGLPISVIDLVRKRCKDRNSSINLKTGIYPVPDYEPFQFWGVPDKLRSI
jgi:dTDP-6-deoxy-L-talose 4-dehydrogenase (NAD+)